MRIFQQPGTFRDLLILLSIGFIIGLYLIATTVVISKDGVFYIETAQKIKDDPARVLSRRPSGYELMILLSHQIYHAITGEDTAQSWIFAAQGVTLLCKLFAIVGYYLAGCLLIGRRVSFWGCVVLLVLPEPAHLGSDVLREWPNLTFMSFSLFFLLYGFKRNRPWAFALVGLLGSLSFCIRPESLSLVIITGALLGAFIVKSTTCCSPLRAVSGLTLLIIGFSGPFLAYASYSGKLNTSYLKNYQNKGSTTFKDLFIEPTDISVDEQSGTASDQSLSEFFYELYKDTGETLMWFFGPFLGIGLYSRLRKKADPVERFIVIAFILTVCGLILFRYWYIQPVISRRWCLSLIALTVFYIPIGIEQSVQWVANRNSPSESNAGRWFQLIMAIGILICVPKLIKPLGFDIKELRQAAGWLKINTSKNDRMYTFDTRIPFYANRKHLLYEDSNKPKNNLKQVEGWGYFNSDAISNILWQNTSSGACLIHLINGTLIFRQSSVPADSSWQIEDLVDFNGDSKTDILWRNTSGAYLIRLMDGTDMLSEAKIPAGNSWQIEDLGDFNGDSKTDILWRNTNSGAYLIRLMNGTSMISQYRILCLDYLILKSTKEQLEMMQWEGLELQRSFPMKSGKMELLIFRYDP